MPEGDTVWRAAHSLHEVLAGQRLTRFELRVPQHATDDLSGHVVSEVASRGKHLLHRIDGWTLHTHLMMDGTWHRYRHGTRWRRPAYQARAILETEQWQTVGFELGIVELVRTDEEDRVVGHLGPDLLGADWDAARALANLSREPDRAVGLALLDQRNLAGVGNVYRAELCFLAGVLPTRAVRDVPDLERLVRLAYRTILANRDRAERTTTGRLRSDRTWVYGRAGRPCFRCGSVIQRGELGDDPLTERITYWCPTCQR